MKPSFFIFIFSLLILNIGTIFSLGINDCLIPNNNPSCKTQSSISNLYSNNTYNNITNINNTYITQSPFTNDSTTIYQNNKNLRVNLSSTNVNGTLQVTSMKDFTRGSGVEIFKTASGQGYVQAYNRDTSSYLPLYLEGDNIILAGTVPANNVIVGSATDDGEKFQAYKSYGSDIAKIYSDYNYYLFPSTDGFKSVLTGITGSAGYFDGLGYHATLGTATASITDSALSTDFSGAGVVKLTEGNGYAIDSQDNTYKNKFQGMTGIGTDIFSSKHTVQGANVFTECLGTLDSCTDLNSNTCLLVSGCQLGYCYDDAGLDCSALSEADCNVMQSTYNNCHTDYSWTGCVDGSLSCGDITDQYGCDTVINAYSTNACYWDSGYCLPNMGIPAICSSIPTEGECNAVYSACSSTYTFSSCSTTGTCSQVSDSGVCDGSYGEIGCTWSTGCGFADSIQNTNCNQINLANCTSANTNSKCYQGETCSGNYESCYNILTEELCNKAQNYDSSCYWNGISCDPQAYPYYNCLAFNTSDCSQVAGCSLSGSDIPTETIIGGWGQTQNLWELWDNPSKENLFGYCNYQGYCYFNKTLTASESITTNNLTITGTLTVNTKIGITVSLNMTSANGSRCYQNFTKGVLTYTNCQTY